MDIKAIDTALAASASVRPARTELTLQTVQAAVTVLPQPAVQASPQAEPERQPVEDAVSSIQQFAQSIQRTLNFALDDSSGQLVVKVTDSISGETIRQIPSEDALRLAESLDEVRSLLFKAEA